MGIEQVPGRQWVLELVAGRRQALKLVAVGVQLRPVDSLEAAGTGVVGCEGESWPSATKYIRKERFC